MNSRLRISGRTLDVLVIAEQPSIVRDLSRTKGLSVRSTTPDRRTAELAVSRPSVVVIDLGTPSGAGLRWVVECTTQDGGPPVVVVASIVRPEVARLVIGAGARAFLSEDERHALLVPAIHAVAAGGVVLSPRVARAIAEGHAGDDEVEQGLRLTKREQAVLEHLARGLTYDEVAEALGVTANTVRTHVRSLYDKLEATSRTEALNAAMRRRLLRPPT